MASKSIANGLGIILLLVLGGCQRMSCSKISQSEHVLMAPRFDLQPKEIDALCLSAQDRFKQRLASVAAVGDGAVFKNTALELEGALRELHITLMPPIFLKYVSDNADVRDAGHRCETAVDQLRVEVFAREDLYRALKRAQDAQEKLAAEDAKLFKETLTAFRRNGLELDAQKRKLFIEKKKRLVGLESEFGKTLNEWNETVELTKSELEGMPESFVSRLEKTPSGGFKVTVKYPDYYPFMENATNPEARRKLDEKFLQRGGSKNLARLQEALKLRSEIAKMLGYTSHAAYVLDEQMAKTPQAVQSFLQRLEGRLKEQGTKDLQALVAAKNEELGAKSDGVIHSHDWRYYENRIKKTKYQVDSQKIKEYFPIETVNKGMFDIYQTILGVEFVKDTNLPTWHPAAVPYRVKQGEQTIAVFYMDLFPREGKYGHAAAFTLVSGFAPEPGKYVAPVSAIVANFNPPDAERPSLLDHGEVETLFHEFGHIMHQVLTTAKHASLSGTSVRRDFVEAPSQMLENWVWDPEMLKRLSGHYKDPSKKLPAEELKRLVDAKLLNVGIRYLRQMLFAQLDQAYHAETPPADSTAVYAKLARETMGIPIPKNAIPQAGFGHLMGGYDAGYYGYLWSEVFAADMFTRFEKEGLLNARTGTDYLQWILQPGGEKEPMDLIRGFLGRDPNENAFFSSLGLGAAQASLK